MTIMRGDEKDLGVRVEIIRGWGDSLVTSWSLGWERIEETWE